MKYKDRIKEQLKRNKRDPRFAGPDDHTLLKALCVLGIDLKDIPKMLEEGKIRFGELPVVMD